MNRASTGSQDLGPMPLLKIQKEASTAELWAIRDNEKRLAELIGELVWHIAILQDRLDQAEIPRLEKG